MKRFFIIAAILLAIVPSLIGITIMIRQAIRRRIQEAERQALEDANRSMEELGWEHHEPAPGVHVWTPPK